MDAENVLIVSPEALEAATRTFHANSDDQWANSLEWGELTVGQAASYRARTLAVLRVAAPHILHAVADDLDGEFADLRRVQGKSFEWLCGIADAEDHIRAGARASGVSEI